MRSALKISSLLLATAFAGASQVRAADTASGVLLGADGKAHGTVTVTEAPKGVLLRVVAEGLAPGWHGMHFHEKAAAHRRNSPAQAAMFMRSCLSCTVC